MYLPPGMMIGEQNTWHILNAVELYLDGRYGFNTWTNFILMSQVMSLLQVQIPGYRTLISAAANIHLQPYNERSYCKSSAKLNEKATIHWLLDKTGCMVLLE